MISHVDCSVASSEQKWNKLEAGMMLSILVIPHYVVCACYIAYLQRKGKIRSYGGVVVGAVVIQAGPFDLFHAHSLCVFVASIDSWIGSVKVRELGSLPFATPTSLPLPAHHALLFLVTSTIL